VQRCKKISHNHLCSILAIPILTVVSTVFIYEIGKEINLNDSLLQKITGVVFILLGGALLIKHIL
jgi:hypothetical protein